MATLLIDGGYFVGRFEKHWWKNPRRKNMKYWWEQGKKHLISKEERDNHLHRLFSYDLGYLQMKINELGFVSEIIVCYDGIYGRRPRGAVYPEYKQNRRGGVLATEHKGIDVRERIKKTLHNPDALVLGWKALYDENMEADDLIGEYCLNAPESEDIIVMSKDKDLLQLMCMPNVEIHDFTNLITKKMFLEEHGVEPEQYLDLKALAGDKSDNIPGIKGVGLKTAAKYLTEYGRIEDFPPEILNAEDLIMVKKWKSISKLPFHQY